MATSEPCNNKLKAPKLSFKTKNENDLQSRDKIKESASSATGNPRNKTALSPGHSLMDWIRLGNSGKDLTGTNGKRINVDKTELAKHCTKDDAWMAIRGVVFNVTHYLNFHPGGRDELMRGVGKDATALFNEIHPWVNYESLLQKCIVGPLVSSIQLEDDEIKRMFITPNSNNSKANLISNSGDQKKLNLRKVSVENLMSLKDAFTENKETDLSKNSTKIHNQVKPKFDWMQVTSHIVLIFYTQKFSNPYVCVKKEDNEIKIFLQYENTCHKYSFYPLFQIQFPGKLCISHHTGKIEIIFNKEEKQIWPSYGKLIQSENIEMNDDFENYTITKDEIVGRNTFIMSFSNERLEMLHFPLGGSVLIKLKDFDVIRPYTPVCQSFSRIFLENSKIMMMIKRYSDGQLTSKLGPIPVEVLIKRPRSYLDLNKLEGHSNFLFIAAGTGIAPFLNLILYLLHRKAPLHSILLIFYNREEEDILIMDKLLELQTLHSQFFVHFVLTKPHKTWTGKHGRINECNLRDMLEGRPTPTCNIVCGPTKFEENVVKLLEKNVCDIILFPG